MGSSKRIEKVWVVTWDKGTTNEWKDDIGYNPPKDYQSIGAETAQEFMFDLYENKRWRHVFGGCQAVFSDKKEAQAWLKASGNDISFIIRPATLTIY